VRSTEHADFFYGHREAGEWEFASTPTVLIEHNRNIDSDYRESRRGTGHVDERLLEDKWGIEGIELGSNIDWAGYRDRTPAEKVFEAFRELTPPTVWMPVKRVCEGVR